MARRQVRRYVKYIAVGCLFLLLVKVWMLTDFNGFNSRNASHSGSAVADRVILRGQELVDYIGFNLGIKYIIVDGTRRIRLTNKGSSNIPPDEPWVIYFNHAAGLSAQALLKTQGLRLVHVDGWLYGLETVVGGWTPITFQGIPAGESLVLRCNASLKSKSYAFPRWYVTSHQSGVEPRIIVSTDSESLDFVESLDPILSPADRYSTNDLDEDDKPPDDDILPIIPTPLNWTWSTTSRMTTVRLGPQWTVNHVEQLAGVSSYLADKLSIKKRVNTKADVNQIQLRLGNLTTHFYQFPHIRSLDEAYLLRVEKNTVIIEGQTSTGVFYGIQSLLSLLESSSDRVSLPLITVVDAPRMPYRGLLLDVARNFIEKKDLFKIMDVMAMYKMNRLHLHLTDDQGWRFEVPGLPELTQIGARRSHDIRQQASLLPYFGSGPFSTNPIGTGHYSVEDYRDILRRASDLRIRVVPEVDMPGHAHAAVQTMRLRKAALMSSADGANHADFLLSDPDDESVYKAVNDHQDTVINPCMDSSYTFVEYVLSALKDIHKDIQPLDVVHLGGDEFPWDALVHSPLCNRFIADHPEWGDHRLKLYFMLRVGRIASRLGLQLQAWEDGMLDQNGRPVGVADWNSTSVYANTFYNSRNHERGDLAFTLANAGYKVILTHATHLYIDHPSETDGEEPGLSWATSSISSRKAFDYIVPVDDRLVNVSSFVKTELCDLYQMTKCVRLTSPENIIGIQASLWGEMVRTMDQIEYMLYPRLLSVAERAWHVADWETTAVDRVDFDRRRRADWRRFASIISRVELRRLERMRVRYRVPPPGVRYDQKQLHVNVELPGLPVSYSVDGGDTWVNVTGSSIETGTTSPTGGVILFVTRSHDLSRSSRRVSVRWPPVG